MRGIRACGPAAPSVALVLAGWLAYGAPVAAYVKFGTLIGGRQITLKWNRLPVRYFVNDQGLPALSSVEYRAALDRAFAAWEAVASSAVTFQSGGLTSSLPTESDGITTIGFMPRPDLDRVLGATSFVIDAVTGEVLEAGIFFNSSFLWSTSATGEAGRYDFESIALHEIGHLVGLGHSALGETEVRVGGRRLIAAEAAMFPIAFSAGSILGRRLTADDVAGVSDVYPTAAFQTDTGSISGRVTKDGRGLFGAHVAAFNPSTGKLVGNFSLTADGEFAIAGLDPGSYVVRVEPLDDADLTSFFPEGANVDVGFRATYADRLAVVPRGGNAGPFEIKVSAR